MGVEEYRNKCDNCGESDDSTFARIFFKMIEGQWKWLCATCWEEKANPPRCGCYKEPDLGVISYNYDKQRREKN